MRRLVSCRLALAALAVLVTAAPVMAPLVTASPAAAAEPTPSASGSAPVPGHGDTRTGGSPSAPGPGKPGWVWWVTAAFVVLVGAGGYRVYQSMHAAEVIDEGHTQDG